MHAWILRGLLSCAAFAYTAGAAAQSKADLFKQVFGKKAEVQRSINAELEVDGYPREALPITVAGATLLDVDLLVLGERLADVLDDTSADCLKGGGAEKRVEQAMSCGLSLRYDPGSLKLVVSVPADHRREQRIGVRSIPSVRPPTANEARLSAYLNLSASARQQQGGAETIRAEALALDGALRGYGSTLEFDGLCGSGGCIPGLRSLVVDQTEALRRWRIGDQPEASAGSLGLPGLRGIGVGTAFELAPERSYTPDLDAPLELNSPATVEVLVNNRTVQRWQLPAGRYSIADFPLGFGANAAELRITDEAGRVTTRQLSAYVDLSLLDQGRSRYSVVAGRPVLAIDNAGQAVRPWTFAADYAFGLGPRSTINAAIASIPDLQRHAAELGLTRALGNWLLGSDLSCASGPTRGCSVNWRFRRGAALAAAEPGWRLEGAVAARQGSYADLLGVASANDSASLLLRASRSLGSDYSLALGLRRAWIENERSAGLVSAQLGGRLGRQFSFRVGVERESGAAADTRILASISWLFDQARQSLQVDADSADALRSARWQVNRGGMRGGYNATLGATQSTLGSSADAAASYRHERFGADFSLSRAMPEIGTSSSESRLSVRSALVYADGHMGITERVLGGFGIVVPADSEAAGTVYVNPVDDDYLASSRGPGPAVVPALRAYDARALLLSLPELRADHDPGELFPVVMPGYKGGVLIPAGGSASVGVQARILDADGLPMEMVSALLQPQDGGAAVSVFAGRGGRLRANGLRPGAWVLLLETRPPRRHALSIPADAQGTIDLGDLRP